MGKAAAPPAAWKKIATGHGTFKVVGPPVPREAYDALSGRPVAPEPELICRTNEDKADGIIALHQACVLYVSKGHHLNCKWYHSHKCDCGYSIVEAAIAKAEGRA